MTILILPLKKKEEKDVPKSPVSLGSLIKVCKILVNYDTSMAIKRNKHKLNISEATIYQAIKYLEQIGAVKHKYEDGIKVYGVVHGTYKVKTLEGIEGTLKIDVKDDEVIISFTVTEKIL